MIVLMGKAVTFQTLINVLMSKAVTFHPLQAAKTVASTIRSVQPAIQDLNQATRDIRTSISNEVGLDSVQREFREIKQSTLDSLRLDTPSYPALSPGPTLQQNIGEGEIAAAASRWTGMQVEDVQKPDASKLLSLKEQLLKRVVGQDEAVTAVANAVIRSRAGLAANERWPSFLFLGPPGVYPCPHEPVCLHGNVCNLMLHSNVSESRLAE
jgi:ATP-dependent Clp protease ATP-binding subunit ClpB